jgi:hypothetical protein
LRISVIRPSLTHACAVWVPLSQASKDSLDSWQYKAAKIVLRTKLNISKAAILLELGLEPLSVFIDRQRISYYKRLLRLPNHRLCKQVYNKMINSFWDYDTLNLDIIRDVTPDVSCFESQSQASSLSIDKDGQRLLCIANYPVSLYWLGTVASRPRMHGLAKV